MYKAQNIDTDKALAAIEADRRIFEEQRAKELKATERYYDGIQQGLDIAAGLFECSNYEKDDTPADTPAESEWWMDSTLRIIKCKNCGAQAPNHPSEPLPWTTRYCPCCGSKMQSGGLAIKRGKGT